MNQHSSARPRWLEVLRHPGAESSRAFVSPFKRGSTADQVLAGIDLSRKRFVVTGCDSGMGFQLMHALAANGAEVIGLGRSADGAREACRTAGLSCTPYACNLADLTSIAAAAEIIRRSHAPLDAIVANAGIAYLPRLETRYGVELQFLVNFLGHFSLVNRLSGVVKNDSGRIVLVGSRTRIRHGTGVMFDNLDGGQFYEPSMFFDQSKFALTLYGKELSRRVRSRGVAVNCLNPGATKGTRFNRHLSWASGSTQGLIGLFKNTPQQGAATHALLAASPLVSGISGEVWMDCRIESAHPLVEDRSLAARLWESAERILASHQPIP